VADDLAPVKRNPVEGCVGELVDVIPAQFLSEESSHASQPAQLRELTGVPKGVRQPKRLTSVTEIALKKPLSIHELPDKGLATGQVGIVLNPAASDGLECTLLDLLLDPVKDIWVILFEPFVLLRL
jgi:hypothetical protein